MPILLFSLYALTTEELTLLSASTLISTVSMWTMDDDIRRLALGNRQFDTFFNITNQLGDGRYHALLFTTGYALGRLTQNERLTEVSSEGFRSFLISGITVLTLKSIIGRARPYMNEGPLSFHPFTLDNDYHSFPSGHTIVAFSTASVISSNFRHPAVYAITYSLATSVAMARIYKDKHWFSDVLTAAVLGSIIGWKIGAQ